MVELAENVLLEIDEKLLKLDEAALLTVINKLQLTAENYDAKRKRSIIRCIQKYMEGVCSDMMMESSTDASTDDDDVDASANADQMVLERLNQLLEVVTKVGKHSNVDEIKINGGKNLVVVDNSVVGKVDGGGTVKDGDVSAAIKGKPTTTFRDLGAVNDRTNILSLSRKEWKLKGCIGDPNANQRDKVSFFSVKSQVGDAVKQGYEEEEIVSAVIRAMHGSIRLKSVLEMKKDLDISSLLGYLQHHFSEKSSPDLCSQLTASTQMPNESSVDFLLRCIELRERLIQSSKVSGEIEYNEPLTQRLFLRTLERGFESPSVLSEVKTLLRREGGIIDDQELLAVVGKAEKDEKERKQIFQRRAVKVHEISKELSPTDKALAGLTSTVANITKQLTALKADIDHIKANQNQNTKPSTYVGCKACVERGEWCSHCYKCGEEGHRGRQCLKTKTPASGEGRKSQ